MALTKTDIQLIQEALKPEFNRIHERIDSLEERIGEIESRMDSIESRMGSLESKMDSLELRIDSLESRMDSLESRMNSMEFKLDTHMQESREEHREIRKLINIGIGHYGNHENRIQILEVKTTE